MTIERKLSKTQAGVIDALVEKRARLTAEIDTLNAALEEQIQMLRSAFGLPEGPYRLYGDKEGITLRKVPEKDEPADTETPEAEQDSEG